MASDTHTHAAPAPSDIQTQREATAALFARRQTAYDNLDAEALAVDYTDDVVIESPFSGRHGKAQAAHNLKQVFSAFMDMKVTPELLLIDGDRVAQLATVEGTNMGGLFGLEASGKAFRIATVFFYELRDGRIARERRVYDFTGLLVQVGVLKAKPV